MFAFQTGQRHLRQMNANFTLGELRALTFARMIKSDRGFDGSKGWIKDSKAGTAGFAPNVIDIF